MSPVFDTSSQLRLVDIADNGERTRAEIGLQDQDLSRRCIRIRNLGVDILICGAITGYFARLLRAAGIEVIPGISGDPEEVLTAYLNGTLSNDRFLMPGCRAFQHRQRQGINGAQKAVQCRKRKRGGVNGRH